MLIAIHIFNVALTYSHSVAIIYFLVNVFNGYSVFTEI